MADLSLQQIAKNIFNKLETYTREILVKNSLLTQREIFKELIINLHLKIEEYLQAENLTINELVKSSEAIQVFQQSKRLKAVIDYHNKIQRLKSSPHLFFVIAERVFYIRNELATRAEKIVGNSSSSNFFQKLTDLVVEEFNTQGLNFVEINQPEHQSAKKFFTSGRLALVLEIFNSRIKNFNTSPEVEMAQKIFNDRDSLFTDATQIEQNLRLYNSEASSPARVLGVFFYLINERLNAANLSLADINNSPAALSIFNQSNRLTFVLHLYKMQQKLSTNTEAEQLSAEPCEKVEELARLAVNGPGLFTVAKVNPDDLSDEEIKKQIRQGLCANHPDKNVEGADRDVLEALVALKRLQITLSRKAFSEYREAVNQVRRNI